MFDMGSRRGAATAAFALLLVLGTLAVAQAVQAKDKDGVCYISTNGKWRYPGDDASAGDIAKWMAAGAQAAGLPPELPVMASLVESNLQNLPPGDADSVGFFQMRVGIWDQGEYQGFADAPELQLKWFIDEAIRFKQTRFESGLTDLLEDSSQWGDWVADIERPAEQFRGRYQLRLAEARRLIDSK
jgi:hypothetical protein